MSEKFQKDLYCSSFSVQMMTYIITLGMVRSFTEWHGLVPSYLVLFHYVEILVRIIETILDALGGKNIERMAILWEQYLSSWSLS